MFVNDLALLASTEDDLQRSIYNFHIVASKYNMEISTEKSKVMAFRGKEPAPSKICLNNKRYKGPTLVIRYHFKER
jgi:hypothetical protein